jgi:hypothetical protein
MADHLHYLHPSLLMLALLLSLQLLLLPSTIECFVAQRFRPRLVDTDEGWFFLLLFFCVAHLPLFVASLLFLKW